MATVVASGYFLGSLLLTERGCTVSKLAVPCSIQALLSAPNPDDPLAENVAKHWKENEAEAVRTGDIRGRLHMRDCCHHLQNIHPVHELGVGDLRCGHLNPGD